MHHHHIAKAAALMLLAVMLVGLSGCADSGPVPIALILSSDMGHYWENISEGAQAAADRMGVQLLRYAPDEEARIYLEDLPLMALEDGAEVFVVASNGEDELIEALKMIPHVTIVAVGAPLQGVECLSTVHNNKAQMGSNMAQALEVLKSDEPLSALLLTDSAEYSSDEACEYNLRSEMFARRIRVCDRIFTGDNRDWAYRMTLQELYLHPELDAVVAFSAQATVGAASAVEYLGRDVIVVGTDIVPEMIEYIESGRVTASVMRSAFGMGYLGVEYAVRDMQDEAVPGYKQLDTLTVNRENLFTADIEKVVFTYE